jgi:hypothetical protein
VLGEFGAIALAPVLSDDEKKFMNSGSYLLQKGFDKKLEKISIKA